MTQHSPPNRHQAIFERFARAFVLADEAELQQLLDPAMVWHTPHGERHEGREAVIAAIQRRRQAPDKPRFADSRFEYFGDTVVQTYQVTVLGPDGQPRTLAGCDVYKVREGRILSKDAYWKQISPSQSSGGSVVRTSPPARDA